MKRVLYIEDLLITIDTVHDMNSEKTLLIVSDLLLLVVLLIQHLRIFILMIIPCIVIQ